DRNTGKDTHPWIEALRQDVFGKIQRNKSEREYADRMRQRNGGSKEYRVFARSARADEIAGNDRFAVTGRQRVHGSEPERDHQREQNNLEVQFVRADQTRKAVLAFVWHGRFWLGSHRGNLNNLLRRDWRRNRLWC